MLNEDLIDQLREGGVGVTSGNNKHLQEISRAFREDRPTAGQVASGITQGVRTLAGMPEGALRPIGEYISRGLGIKSELGNIADRLSNNPLMAGLDDLIDQEGITNVGKVKYPNTDSAKRKVKEEFVNWLNSMNPDQPQSYKDLGAPARFFGTRETALPDGSIKFGNSDFKDSPVYNIAPGYWDSFARWSTMPFGQIKAELQEQFGPNAEIDEQQLRKQINSYNLLVNGVGEVAQLHQEFQYPKDSAYIRDYQAYVDQWEALDKSGGLPGGMANWWDDVKAMGEGTYQFITSIAGMAELEPGKTAYETGVDFGSAFTGGLAGSLAAAMGVDEKTGERRIYRKPMILLGTIGPTIFNLARAIKHGYASPSTISKVERQAKVDSRFGKVLNAAMDAVDTPLTRKVSEVTDRAFKPVKIGLEKLDQIDTGSLIRRRDEAVGRPGAGGVDMPSGQKFKFDPDSTFNVDPVSFKRRQGGYVNRTYGDMARAALRDMGFWTITGLPVTNPLGAALAVGAQGLTRWGYGAVLKNSPAAMRFHRLLTKNFTLFGKTGQLDEVDNRSAEQAARDYVAQLEANFRVKLTEEVKTHLENKLKDKSRSWKDVDPDAIAREEIPIESAEAVGVGFEKDAAPSVEVGPFGELVDSRLVARRYENVVKKQAPAKAEAGKKVKVSRADIPEEVKANYLRAKNNLTTINDTLAAQETLGSRVPESETTATYFPEGEARQRDKFGVMGTEKPRYPRLNDEQLAEYRAAQQEAAAEFLKAEQAYRAAEANALVDRRETVGDAESPIDKYETAKPERATETIKVGDTTINAQSVEAGKKTANETQIKIIKLSAREVLESITPEAIREQNPNVQLNQADVNYRVETLREAVRTAEEALIERYESGGSVAVKTEEKFVQKIKELSDEIDFDADDWDRGGRQNRRADDAIGAVSTYFTLLDGMRKEKWMPSDPSIPGVANSVIQKQMEIIAALETRFGPKSVNSAIAKAGPENTFTENGALIIGSPLYNLARGIEAPSFKVKQGGKDLRGPTATLRKPESQIGKIEASFDQPPREGVKVNLFDETTGLWTDEFVSTENLNAWARKQTPKERQAAQQKQQAYDKAVNDEAKKLGRLGTGKLVAQARARGLLSDQQLQNLSGSQLELAGVRGGFEEGAGTLLSPQDVPVQSQVPGIFGKQFRDIRSGLIRRLAQDLVRDKKPEMAGTWLKRSLNRMDPKQVKEFADKNKIKLTGVRKKDDRIALILETLSDRATGAPGLSKARGELDALKQRANNLEANLAGDRRRMSEFEETETFVFDQMELDDLRSEIRKKELEVRRLESQDSTIRMRDLSTRVGDEYVARPTKEQRQQEGKLKKAQEEVEALSDKQVIEELSRFDPDARKTYKTKRVREGGQQVAVPAVQPEAFGRAPTPKPPGKRPKKRTFKPLRKKASTKERATRKRREAAEDQNFKARLASWRKRKKAYDADLKTVEALPAAGTQRQRFVDVDLGEPQIVSPDNQLYVPELVKVPIKERVPSGPRRRALPDSKAKVAKKTEQIYRWSPKRVGEAWKTAKSQLENYLQDPSYSRVVMMVGLPGSGKSTWISRNKAAGTVYFDATFTTARGRADIIRRVKDAGKSVEAVVMKTPSEVSIARNLQRTADRTVNPEAVERMAKQLADEPPRMDEGFNAIWDSDDPNAAKPFLEPKIKEFDVQTGPLPEGALEAGATKSIPSARDALARFKASGAKPANPTYKFAGSTQEATAKKLLTKFRRRLNKKSKKADKEIEDATIAADPELDSLLAEAQLILDKDPNAKIVRVLRKYIELKGGQASPFSVKVLNELLKEAGEDIRLPTFTKQKDFKAASDKKKADKLAKETETTETVAREQVAAKKSRTEAATEKRFKELESEVNKVYNSVIKLTAGGKRDFRRLNSVLVGLPALVGKVGRLAVSLETKRPLLQKLRDISSEASDRVQAQKFSEKFDTLGEEIQALYDGEIIPELMAANRGSAVKLQSALKRKDTGIFDKISKKVDELRRTAEASSKNAEKFPDNKKYQELAKTARDTYYNALNDQTTVLARMAEELQEGQMQSLADAMMGVDARVYKKDPQAPYMFTRKAVGKEVSSKHARDAFAKTIGLQEIDGSYYLDTLWYTERGAKRIPGTAQLATTPSIQGAITSEVLFRDMQKAESIIRTELIDKQNRNSRIPGTREHEAVRAAALINDSSVKLPENLNKNFKAEVFRFKRMLDDGQWVNPLKAKQRISESSLSPAEKYAIFRELDIIDQIQASRSPGVNKLVGGRLTKDERRFINSPVITDDAVVMDAKTGKTKRSEKFIVRLSRPWSREFEAEMQRYTKNMTERFGRSKSERDAFVANVIDIFNQGNSLLLSEPLRNIVADLAVKSIDDQIMANRRASAKGARLGMSPEERKNLTKNINSYLHEFSLPYRGSPSATQWSTATVEAAKTLAKIPTRFEYRQMVDIDGKKQATVLGSADIIGLTQEAFNLIKTKKEKQLVVFDAVRGLTSAIQSQAKGSALVTLNNNENNRFDISYSDEPLDILSKYTYNVVFKGDARPMSLAYAARNPNRDAVQFITKSDILGSYTGRFKEFVDKLQDIYDVDLKQNIANRHDIEVPLDLTTEFVDKVNKKYGTNYEYVLTEQKIRDAFGSLSEVAEGSPVSTFLNQMRDETSTLGDMTKVGLSDINSIESALDYLEGRQKFVTLLDEIKKERDSSASIYSELAKEGAREIVLPSDFDITSGPQGLVTDKIFDITMNKGFLDTVAWDAQLAREMQKGWGAANSMLKAGLTVKSAITQLGNIVGNKLAIMATTGEDMVSLGWRIARSEQLFYAHRKNKKLFDEIVASKKMPADARDVILAVETIHRHTGLDAMDSYNAEIGTKAQRGTLKYKPSTTKAGMVARHTYDIAAATPRGVQWLQEFMYKHGDAAPRRAEVLREFVEGKQLLDSLQPGEGIAFKVSRKGYTTFLRDEKGIYQQNKHGKKIYQPDLKKVDPDSFVAKVLASYAVRKVSGRVFNYRNVPRIVESVRSGKLGAASSLFFSPFISFPYLAADFFGKKGILASTFFEPFFDDSFVTNSKRVMLTKSYKDTVRGVRRGLMMTAAQAIRYPDANAYVEDAKFRRDANTFGAVLPSRSNKPGFYKYFTWSNANGFETSYGLINYVLGMQAYLASQINRAMGKDEEDLNDFGKLMLAQVAAKESATAAQLLSLFTFGGNLVASMVADYKNPSKQMGPLTQRFLAAAIGKDQSRFLNALLTMHSDGLRPTSKFSVYRPDVMADFSNQTGTVYQFGALPKEEQEKYIKDNFWPIIFNMRFREKRILDKVKPTEVNRNNATKAFLEGLREGVVGDIDERIGLPVPVGGTRTQAQKTLFDLDDIEDLPELRKIQTAIGLQLTGKGGKGGGIVTTMIEYYSALNTFDERKKAYEKALLSKDSKAIYRTKKSFKKSKQQLKEKRSVFFDARQRAATLKTKRRKMEK